MSVVRRFVTTSTTMLVLLAGAGVAQGQLIVIAYDNGGSVEKLFEVDRSTGSLDDQGTIPTCCAVPGPVSAGDTPGRRIHFVDVTSGAKLFTVDTTDASVVANPSLPTGNHYEFLERDPDTGTIYTVYRTNGVEFHLAQLDPSSGALSGSGATISGCCGTWSAGQSTLGDGTFYFIGAAGGSSTDFRLWKVDITTGVATDVALPAGGGTGNQYQFFHRDSASGTLYLVYRPYGGVSKLATVNPATGTLSDVGTGTGISSCCNAPNGDLSGVDPGAGLFYFIGSDDNGTRKLFRFALSDGIGGPAPSLSTSYNYNYFEALTTLFVDGFESAGLSRWSLSLP